MFAALDDGGDEDKRGDGAVNGNGEERLELNAGCVRTRTHTASFPGTQTCPPSWHRTLAPSLSPPCLAAERRYERGNFYVFGNYRKLYP